MTHITYVKFKPDLTVCSLLIKYIYSNSHIDTHMYRKYIKGLPPISYALDTYLCINRNIYIVQLNGSVNHLFLKRK